MTSLWRGIRSRSDGFLAALGMTKDSLLWLREGVAGGGEGLLPHHDAARVLEHHRAVVLDAQGPEFDDAPLRLGLRLALVHDLALGVDGLALEQRVGQLDLVPAQGEAVFARIRHAETGHNRNRQRRVHERPPELGLRRVVLIEMDLVGVVGQQGEPDVVGLGNRPPNPAAVDVADLEVLVKPALPARLYSRHSFRNSLVSATGSSVTGTVGMSSRVAPASIQGCTRSRTSSTDVAAIVGSPSSSRSLTAAWAALKPPLRYASWMVRFSSP